MAKKSDVIINTVTDTGVEFGIGNAMLNWGSTGFIGLLFNVASIGVCGALRARAEFGHAASADGKQQTKFDQILNHRGTSLAFAGGMQLAVATTAAVSVGIFSAGAIIPFAFAMGNTLAAIGIEGPHLENIRRKFEGALTKRKAHPTIAKMTATILTTPEVWFATGLVLTAGALAPTALFALAGSVAVLRAVRKSKPDWLASRTKLVEPYVRGENSALFTLAGGNFLVAAANLTTNWPKSVITGLFGLGYVSIYAANKFGGIAQALRGELKPKSPTPQAPAA